METIMPRFDPAVWQGRVDDEPGDTRRWHQVVRGWTPMSPAGTALVGFACDAGVRRNQGRPGAAAGPNAIRGLLANLAWHGRRPIIDAGDVGVASSDDDAGDLEGGQQRLADTVAALLDERHQVIVLGGGHEVAWGSHLGLMQQLARREPGATVGIINFDAHFDLRTGARGSSGTPFRQVADAMTTRGGFHYLCLGVNEDANTEALFSTARQLGAGWRLDRRMGLLELDETRAQLAAFVAAVDYVHLSIDLDVFPAATAPGVSAPAARGVALEIVEELLDELRASGKVLLTDIAEYNPRYDIDQRTARVAARLVAQLAR